MSEQPSMDVAVIGGGVTGLSIAAALAKEKLRVTLYERGEIHRATSANSHRIIHGGFRYLQTGDFARLSRSLAAKNLCLKKYPEEIVPLRCYFAVPEKGLKRSPLLGFAGAVYGASATLLGHSPEWTCLTPIADVKNLSSFFQNLLFKKAFQWTDARIRDPERLGQRLLQEFLDSGGVLHEHTPVVEITKSDSCCTIITENKEETSSRMAVLALGPWHGGIALPDALEFSPFGWAKAWNLVLSERIVQDDAVAIPGANGQVLFFAPREEGGCAVGTWYKPYTGESAEVSVSSEEVNESLREVNEVISPPEPLRLEDILSVECGVLPMKGLRAGVPQLYGSEKIVQQDEIVSILSTKYTVFPTLAAEVSSRVRAFLR